MQWFKKISQDDGNVYRGPSAVRQIWLLAAKDVAAGFRAKAYRIAALIIAVLAFVAPLVIPNLLEALSGGEKTVAVVGSAEDRQAWQEMGPPPPGVKYDPLEQAPVDPTSYDLVLDLSASPVTMRTEKLSQLVKLQSLTKAAELFQERRQLWRAGIASPHVPVAMDYARDDSGEVARIFTAFIIVFALTMLLPSFVNFVLQGTFSDKANRIVDVLYPQTTAFRLLAGKILGVGIFGWLQLFSLAVLALVSIALFTDFDWQQLLLPSVVVGLAWFIVGYLFLAFIAGALASTIRKTEMLTVAQSPLLGSCLLAYFLGYTAIFSDDLSAPWAWWLGLFPPFSSVFVPAQVAAGNAEARYLALAAVVSGGCVLLAAFVGSKVYKRCILGRVVKP